MTSFGKGAGPLAGQIRIRSLPPVCCCAITYAIATVDGFGWLLLAMGAAQCTLEQHRTRIAYIALFVLIIFYREVDWAERVFL